MHTPLEGKSYGGELRSLSVHPGEEETEGTPECSYSFLRRGKGEAGTDLPSVVTMTALEEMA